MKKRSDRELNIVISLKQPIKQSPGSGGNGVLFPGGSACVARRDRWGVRNDVIEESLVIKAVQMV
ncbi:MAG: hypothetical protein JXR85_03590 [Deltaproteobacteria bacterium]|nr:hypothetical protein [Deltaproteobacteria bacterium]